jgi:uncharacterized protein
MRPWIKPLLIAGLFSLVPFSGAGAGPLEDSETALQNGDYALVLRLLRPLADGGNADAQIKLGDMYDKGQGVPQDYSRAVAWYRKAASTGSVEAFYILGQVYSKGRSIPDITQDYIQAAMWYRKAADKGLFVAQFLLGEMYENGQGVPQDYVQAHMWFNLAASRPCKGHDLLSVEVCKYDTADAISDRDEVATKMTPSQIAEAQRMASEWK